MVLCCVWMRRQVFSMRNRRSRNGTTTPRAVRLPRSDPARLHKLARAQTRLLSTRLELQCITRQVIILRIRFAFDALTVFSTTSLLLEVENFDELLPWHMYVDTICFTSYFSPYHAECQHLIIVNELLRGGISPKSNLAQIQIRQPCVTMHDLR